MPRSFESFVILADMRTGSNALEERLNDYVGLKSHGEVFNPHFIGHAGKESLFGLTCTERDADPSGMLDAMAKQTHGIAGFRLFSDHDRRVLELCLRNRNCAKVVLTRNPLNSYVSLKIARKTGQWWLGDLKTAKSGKAHFDKEEFEKFLSARAEWLKAIRHHLQISGQTAFSLSYDDLRDEEVIAGLARFLGAREKADAPTRKGRIQNPISLSEKLSNFAEMKQSLREVDLFDMDAFPDFEPARGPNVPSYVTARTVPLLFMPVKCAEDRRVRVWLAALDGVSPEGLETGFTQRSLRQWKRRHGSHMSFTVVRHPVARAYEAFCRFILPTASQGFTGIRGVLEKSYKLPLPDDPTDPGYDLTAHRECFLSFLKFLKGNLGGQTAVRIDAAWASQENSVRGLASFGVPDAVLRGDTLERDLAQIADRFGVTTPAYPSNSTDERFPLTEVYDERIERAARSAYQRDYMMFGFGAWR